MIKRPRGKGGTLVTLAHESKVLRGNALGDPHARQLAVWLPPQYDEGAGHGRGRRYSVLFDLVGFTGSGLSHIAWKNFSENLPERAARLIHEGKMGPAILVFPDCFTALGGNQYVNSSAIGSYADYLTRELVLFVDREFRTLASRDHRGCFGKSSGGYGAIVHGMKYAPTWGAVADHSGARSGRGTKAPNGFRLPFNLETGEVLPERWRRWRAHDPINLVKRYRRNLASLRGIYIDCGSRDQYHIYRTLKP